MNDPTIAPARPGLRERKKEQTRKVIAETAEALFEERGFDGVTVAEIADAANVSVKTLFTYFESKEDLVFANENELRDQLIARVRDRAPGQSAFDAVAGFLTDLVLAAGRRPVLASLEGFRRSVDSPAVQSRLRLMWERYEEALAVLLATETGAPPHDPRPRMAAAQLIAVFRLLGSDDVRKYVRSHPAKEQKLALETWLGDTLESVGKGVRRYAVRPGSP
jgi:AcrR family transcriptional regulator